MPGITRHGETEQAQIDHILYVRWSKDRHTSMHQRQLALMRDGGGLPAMVVTRHADHTAIGMSPCELTLLERVAGTINPGPLPVPYGEGKGAAKGQIGSGRVDLGV